MPAGPLSRFFLFAYHVNHHVEHHLYPAVPWCTPPRLHAALRARGLPEGVEVRTLPDTVSRIFAPGRRALAA